jgi:hypothetical protein
VKHYCRAQEGTSDVITSADGAACAHYAARAGLSAAVVDRGLVVGGTTGAGEGNLLVSDVLGHPSSSGRRRGLLHVDAVSAYEALQAMVVGLAGGAEAPSRAPAVDLGEL